MKYLLAILAFAGIASAQNAVIFDSRISPWTNTNVRSIDLAVKARELNPDLYDWTNSGYVLPSVVPALVSPKLNLWVPITGTLAQARADLRAADGARRPAKMELEAFLGGQTPKQFRQSLRSAYRNVDTNTAFTAAQRRVLTNMLWAVGAEDDFAELRQAKQAEDIDLGITKEDGQ